MPKIIIETDPDAARLSQLGIERWPVWEKGVSEFAWEYGEKETSYIVEGRVIVTPTGGEPVEIGRGDLVTFPAGLACTWKIMEPVRKHYRLG
jgi:uncharacterized protein